MSLCGFIFQVSEVQRHQRGLCYSNKTWNNARCCESAAPPQEKTEGKGQEGDWNKCKDLGPAIPVPPTRASPGMHPWKASPLLRPRLLQSPPTQDGCRGHHSLAFSTSAHSDAALPGLPLPPRVDLMCLVAELLRKNTPWILTALRSADLSSEAGNGHAITVLRSEGEDTEQVLSEMGPPGFASLKSQYT